MPEGRLVINERTEVLLQSSIKDLRLAVRFRVVRGAIPEFGATNAK